ncbi:MAG: hypothetical protein HBSAPP03_26160 [Phycisphaerae bacterium]|nr:MAG: hypothetical protein HBSAPP03_26160 [Phycisphaerae bacterium]
MNLRAWLAMADRAQRSRRFKVIATVAVVVVAVIGATAYLIAVDRATEAATASPTPATSATLGGESPTPDPAIEASRAIIREILAARSDPTGVLMLIGVGTLLYIAAVWLDLGLTVLGLGLAAAGVFSLAWTTAWGKAYAPLGMGLVALTGAFVILMRLARLVLGGATAVAAVARTVLAEAVRMRLTLFFIVLLIFLLAALPMLLTADTSLRYRVQQFLQYGVSGSFHLIALLTVLFAVATVTFDQRDKTIWQTMTKPVAAWQYVMGKFLGVWVLSGVLLAVTGTGVFLFVEYLRTQPAAGEGKAYITGDVSISDDRLLLDRLVLAAREAREPDPLAVDEAQLMRNIQQKIDMEIERLQGSIEAGERVLDREKIARDMNDGLRKAVRVAQRTLGPGETREFVFSGLAHVRDQGGVIFLRYKINSGSNDPSTLYRVTMQIGAAQPEIVEVTLGQFQTLNLLPAAIGPDGRLTLRVANGDVFQRMANAESFTFPPDGLEVSYAAGSYGANFTRVFAVLWIKLAFLAMLGVCMGTFLSFPVACLVAITVFMAAEGSGFLRGSLENYWTEDEKGNTLYFNTVVAAIAGSITWFFQLYGDLRPTQKLVEGLRLTWGSVGKGATMSLALTFVLYAAAAFTIRRRELAVYSGH